MRSVERWFCLWTVRPIGEAEVSDVLGVFEVKAQPGVQLFG